MATVNPRDGTVLSWQTSGQGPSLLLVHGTTADHTRWVGISEKLAERFTVHAMDRRGRGGSGDAETYEIEREFEDVAAVAVAVGEPVSVLAHSHGAVCSLEAALLTDAIDRMVLYEPPVPTGLPTYPPGLPDRMQRLVDGGEAEGALELFFREVVRMPDHEFDQYCRLPVWSTRVSLAPTIPREMAIDRHYTFQGEKFTDLDTHTRLLLGGDSPPLFRRAIETVEAVLANVDVVELPGQQHIATDTDPEAFLDAVTGFLDSWVRRRMAVTGSSAPSQDSIEPLRAWPKKSG